MHSTCSSRSLVRSGVVLAALMFSALLFIGGSVSHGPPAAAESCLSDSVSLTGDCVHMATTENAVIAVSECAVGRLDEFGDCTMLLGEETAAAPPAVSPAPPVTSVARAVEVPQASPATASPVTCEAGNLNEFGDCVEQP